MSRGGLTRHLPGSLKGLEMNRRVIVPVAMAGLLVCAGCISDKEMVRRKVTTLVNENKYDDARNLKVKQNPGGIPKTDEEKVKDELILTLVNPSEAKFIASRAKKLHDEVAALLAKGDDAAARKYIYEFGVIGQPTVDGAIFLVKTGILNSHINPKTYNRLSEAATKTVPQLIAAGDFQKALEEIAKIRPVLAYPEAVETGLDGAGQEAIAQRCEEEGVRKLVAGVKEALYSDIAGREGYDKTDYVPDWTKVYAQLDAVYQALVNDDVKADEAKRIVDNLAEGLKSYFNDAATDENFTTAELNSKIANLRADYRAKVSKELEARIAKAAAEEATRLRKLALEFARQAAEEVDMDARIAAIVDAISDRTEPDINKVLGDGARALRLYNAGYEVTKADASSLLVAATYMGFDDVMNLAIALKADVNGTSSKDSLGRTPYLVGLQYGFKGNAKSILAAADRSIRDANGCGAMHYAVRYAGAKAVMEALDLGLDAKAPSKDGVTPLMIAAKLDSKALVEALLPFSDVNAADSQGFTALIYASQVGNLQIAKDIVAAKANVAAKTKEKYARCALDFAVEHPSEALIDYFLDDLKVAPTEYSVTWCVINGKVLPLTTLVAHGGKVTDDHLAAACVKGHLDMVKYLVSLGRDVNSEAVHAAVSKGINTEISEFLYANGYRAKTTDVSAKDTSTGIYHL